MQFIRFELNVLHFVFYTRRKKGSKTLFSGVSYLRSNLYMITKWNISKTQQKERQNSKINYDLSEYSQLRKKRTLYTKT